MCHISIDLNTIQSQRRSCISVFATAEDKVTPEQIYKNIRIQVDSYSIFKNDGRPRAVSTRYGYLREWDKLISGYYSIIRLPEIVDLASVDQFVATLFDLMESGGFPKTMARCRFPAPRDTWKSDSGNLNACLKTILPQGRKQVTEDFKNI